MTNTSVRTKNMVLAALCAALMAVLSPWSIPIGPISLTLGVFAVFFAGALLTPAWAFAAVLVYLALGGIGLPVFSGFKSGPAALMGPTGGYLLAYGFMALILAWFCTRFAALWQQTLGVVLALAVCYGFGTAWFMAISGNNLATSLAWCVTPFILPDLCKGLAALLLAKVLKNRLR